MLAETWLAAQVSLVQTMRSLACLLYVCPTLECWYYSGPLVQGTTSAEVQAVAIAQSQAVGSTVYLNLETGDCHGDSTSLSALIQAGVSRVVVGMRHPLANCRGTAIQELRQHGVAVDVLGETACLENVGQEESTMQKCFVANEVCCLCLQEAQPV